MSSSNERKAAANAEQVVQDGEAVKKLPSNEPGFWKLLILYTAPIWLMWVFFQICPIVSGGVNYEVNLGIYLSVHLPCCLVCILSFSKAARKRWISLVFTWLSSVILIALVSQEVQLALTSAVYFVRSLAEPW